MQVARTIAQTHTVPGAQILPQRLGGSGTGGYSSLVGILNPCNVPATNDTAHDG